MKYFRNNRPLHKGATIEVKLHLAHTGTSFNICFIHTTFEVCLQRNAHTFPQQTLYYANTKASEYNMLPSVLTSTFIRNKFHWINLQLHLHTPQLNYWKLNLCNKTNQWACIKYFYHILVVGFIT